MLKVDTSQSLVKWVVSNACQRILLHVFVKSLSRNLTSKTMSTRARAGLSLLIFWPKTYMHTHFKWSIQICVTPSVDINRVKKQKPIIRTCTVNDTFQINLWCSEFSEYSWHSSQIPDYIRSVWETQVCLGKTRTLFRAIYGVFVA